MSMASVKKVSYFKMMVPNRPGQGARALGELQKAGINLKPFPQTYINATLDTCQEKVKLFTDIPPFIDFYFRDVTEYEPDSLKHFTPENKPRLQRLRDAFAKLPNFDAASVEAALKSVAAELNVKAGVLVHPLRVACTGKSFYAFYATRFWLGTRPNGVHRLLKPPRSMLKSRV